MTDQVAGHGDLDELAAAHVLHALEPADEQRFLDHARQCRRCQQLVVGFRQVTEAMAQTALPAEPSTQLSARILAEALADSAR